MLKIINFPLIFYINCNKLKFNQISINQFNRNFIEKNLKSKEKFPIYFPELCEELALANSIKGLDGTHEDIDEVTDDAITFNVKYLGNTAIEEQDEEFETKKKKLKPRSDIATSNAIKKIITNSKNNKKLERVSLAISPKGIEIIDPVTGDTIQQISIYKISFCSVEKSFQDVFAFVASNIEKEPNMKTTSFMPSCSSATKLEAIEEEQLVCYAFMCQKRKVAQKMALTVARAFERAYQIWQNQEFQREVQQIKSLTAVDSNESMNKENIYKFEDCDDNGKSFLIDFSTDSTTTELCFKGNKEYLQNTWVRLLTTF
jgi:low density lipoprotein receptor adapter protein 1